MNIQEADVLKSILYKPYINQRAVADTTRHSIGTVNKALRSLIESGYIDENMQPTKKARNEVKEKAPKNAIILAAGFGMRMVPINLSTPKGLLEINKERLIDRIITQLREAGVEDYGCSWLHEGFFRVFDR